jgi:hypothetical protein
MADLLLALLFVAVMITPRRDPDHRLVDPGRLASYR